LSRQVNKVELNNLTDADKLKINQTTDKVETILLKQ